LRPVTCTAPFARAALELGRVEVRAGAAFAERQRGEHLPTGHRAEVLGCPIAASGGDRR